jgi:putative intracellular protease/amidase
MQKVLFVLTSHDKLGNTGKETGFYLSEVTHPYHVFEQAEVEVVFVSPKGGKAPMIGIDLQDPLNKAFMDDSAKLAKVEQTLSPAEVNPTDYDAIFYAGGMAPCGIFQRMNNSLKLPLQFMSKVASWARYVMAQQV